jgi:hypothetical protein
MRDDRGKTVVILDHETEDLHHDVVDDPIVCHPIVDHRDDGSGDTDRLVPLW